MKAEATIRREVRRLRAIVRDKSVPNETRNEAYETYHGLLWVLGKMDYRPSTMIRMIVE